MAWQLKQRWTEAGDLGWPMLESSVARQARGGKVTAGECNPGVRPGGRLALRLPAARALGRRVSRAGAGDPAAHSARRLGRGGGNGDRDGGLG
jgi:hypothetical protein